MVCVCVCLCEQDAERLKQQESEVAALQKELGSLQASLDSEAEAIRGANTEVGHHQSQTLPPWLPSATFTAHPKAL
jgi:hypothetical protein